jgi:NADPH-dependent ferric siderophore reductase
MPTWTGNEFLLPDGTRPPIRTLTPRRFDPVASEIDLDIVMHEEGALPSWVATLDADGTAELDTAEGGGIALSGPARGYVPNKEVHTFVLGGDETAIPAISQIIAALPDGATVQVVIEVGSLDARFDVGTPNVDWRACSDDREPGGELVAGMRAAIERMPRDAQIWAAGEAAAVQRIRRIVFDELGLPRSQATIRGYWKHGRSGASELSAT